VTQYITPAITVTPAVDGTPEKPVNGTITLAALGVPYATATIVLPLTADTLLDTLDPRDDHRVIIGGSSTGHWESVTGYGTGGYGHGPYGH
jgi:hypothetical protein